MFYYFFGLAYLNHHSCFLQQYSVYNCLLLGFSLYNNLRVNSLHLLLSGAKFEIQIRIDSFLALWNKYYLFQINLNSMLAWLCRLSCYGYWFNVWIIYYPRSQNSRVFLQDIIYNSALSTSIIIYRNLYRLRTEECCKTEMKAVREKLRRERFSEKYV